jgi:hypothetical protein
LSWILKQKGNKKLFLKLISRWAWRGCKKELRSEYLDDIRGGGINVSGHTES